MEMLTARLRLRVFVPGDIKQMGYLSDHKVMRYIEPPYDERQSQEFVLRYGCCENPLVYALEERASQTVIGHVIFHPFDTEDVYELGWILCRQAWGKGYGEEVSRTLLQYARENPAIHRVVAETVPENKDSLALIRKLGMKQVRAEGPLLLFALETGGQCMFSDHF